MRYWTLDEATAALPHVREAVGRIRELVEAMQSSAEPNHAQPSGNGQVPGTRSERSAELETLVGELTDQGIVVRDPARGLIDFPAQSPSGREYLLCWLDGEDAIDWWHWPDAGFAGRTPLTSPPE
ncbi:MAG: DUF2203 family protein [Actinobacteria bacterium]|nr:MAG: DUF2203 family protein [Actinomycetota bacterium]